MREYTKTEILTSLKGRLGWYEKACLIKGKTIPYENGFDFPEGNIDNWYGAIKELNNTISMLEHGIKCLEKEEKIKLSFTDDNGYTEFTVSKKWYDQQYLTDAEELYHLACSDDDSDLSS